MVQHRHATPLNDKSAKSWPVKQWLKQRLDRLGQNRLVSFKPNRLQTALLTLAACSVALGLGNSMQPESNAAPASLLSSVSSIDAAANADSSSKTDSELKDEQTQGRKVIELELPTESLPVAAIDAPIVSAAITQSTASAAKLTAVAELHTVLPEPAPLYQHIQQTIKKGDNLSMVFSRVGLNGKDVYQVVESGKEGKALTRMFPGEELEFVLDKQNRLQKIIRIKSPLESVYFVRQDDQPNPRYDIKTVTRKPEIKTVHRSAHVNNSLSLSAQQADISQSITMNMANIFGGVIDFVLDVRNGDQFTVIYEELYIDGEKIDNGKIVAAQYINRDKVYNAYRYTDPDGDTGYYNEDGVSMRKAFLRAPVDFTRISSGFNLRRLHPITKKVKPHRGIDYAAPRGTPVFSVGEGRVIASSKNRSNGNYVFVKHGESYVTKYLHLHKRNVKKGQRVKQGQIIGQVGCTGLCTGPHLHYEFLVSGVHRNPRTIMKKLPKAKTNNKNLKSDFIASIEPIQLQLASYSSTFSNTKLASNQ
jgi:murein DD-endopeptidase MepM/ murein hydrolase activator NlpD